MVKLPFILAVKFSFYFLDFIIPKKKNLILLASRFGSVPNANISELFKELENIENFEYYNVERKNSKRTLDFLSFKGFWKILRAKYVFVTHGPGDILYAFYSPRKIVTYVGHGMPLKSFVFTNPHMKFKERLLHRLEVPTYNYVVASSEWDRESLKKCFRKTNDEVIITGLPRNDILIRSNKTEKKKIILYAPTYRDDKSFSLFPYADMDFTDLDDTLEELGAILYLRLHFNDKNKLNLDDFKNIKFLDHIEIPEIQDYLPNVDVLISDYSSIYLDYLLLNRPLIFLCYDLEEYTKMRGFLYEYDSVTPGYKPNSYKELKVAIHDSLFKDDFRAERNVVKNSFHQFDNNFSKRLLKRVLRLG